MRSLNARGKLLLALLLIVGAILASCEPIPRTLPPGLEQWAARKAVRLAQCLEAGHRGQDLFDCLAEYAPDRGTFACERARQAIAEHRSAG